MIRENKHFDQTNRLTELAPNRSVHPDATSNDVLLRDAGVCRVLLRLNEANSSAVSFDRDPWDFAVELPQLSEFGVGTHTLRTMICRQWITHMREVPNASENRRKFEAESDLVLSPRSCFVLTQKGFDIAQKLDSSGKTMTDNAHSDPNNPDRREYPTPCWDREKRELRIGDVVVKRFKWPAENQEQVLDAFEEEGWPTRIDDPLVPHPKICPKRRLHDTLKCLNRKQLNDFIKFRGDGTGQGVLLEINWNSQDDAP